MTHEDNHPDHHEPAPEQGRPPDPEDALGDEIERLFRNGLGKKTIARKLGLDPKTVRGILADRDVAAPAPQGDGSKLDPFRDIIREKVEKGLSGTRIHREISGEGYEGGVTILRDWIREIRGPARPKAKAFRRFETPPGEEAQVDWSPYRLTIAGIECVVQCFAMILCWSRFVFIQFHRDQKLPSLLAAHVAAFEAFGGAPARIVYDNMATVTLGRRGKEPIWNPAFLRFIRQWMVEPYACRPRDPNRKGKDERIFSFLESSLLRGRDFASWDELDREAKRWLDEVANCRVHGTTREVPEQRWRQERELLTPPPETPYPTYREETRTVGRDCIISVGGHRYSVPADLARCTVSVRVHPRHIEVLDASGVLRAQHRIPDRQGGLVIEEAHYASIHRGPRESISELDRRFLVTFPGCQAFLDGLKLRMKALWHIHLRKLDTLVSIYGLDRTREAVEQASGFGNFNASAVARILERRYPLMAVDAELRPLALQGTPEALSDVDGGSLGDYRELLTTEPDRHDEDLETDDIAMSSDPEDSNSNDSNDKEENDDGMQGQLAPIG